jgi:hypothetical protein
MPPTDPGVQVATGDPDQLGAAAAAHEHLAGTLEGHSSTISGTAGSLDATWQGESAKAYQQLSTLVSTHFQVAANEARYAAGILRRYQGELAGCQKEGRQALTEATHWLNVANQTAAKLEAAQQAASTDMSNMNGAMNVLRALRADTDDDSADTRKTFENQVSSAGKAYGAAESEVSRLQAELKHAQTELTKWQQKGKKAWDDAEAAARAATGGLTSINVTPPPLAGGPANAATSVGLMGAFAAYTKDHGAEALWGMTEGAAKRFREGHFITANTPEAQTNMQTLGEELAGDGGDDYVPVGNSGLVVPKGSSADPNVAKLNAAADDPGMKSNTTRFLTQDEKALEDMAPKGTEILGKSMGVASLVYTGYETATDEWGEDTEKGYSTAHKVEDTTVVTGATVAGAIGGAEAGAEGGAIVGSFIGPEGTVAGGIIGGVVGGAVGGIVGSGIGNKLGHVASTGIYDAGKGLESAGKSVGHGLESAGKGIGHFLGGL